MNPLDRFKDRDQLSKEMPDYSGKQSPKNGGNDRQYNFVIYLIFGICFLLGGLFVPTSGQDTQQTLLLLGVVFIIFSLAIRAASARNMSLMQFIMTLSLRNLRGNNNQNTSTKKKKK